MTVVSQFSFLKIFVFLLITIATQVCARGAGECAMICNDLRFEVLTMEMCKEARKTLPRPKVGDFCGLAMEQGFSDACVPLCQEQKPVSRVAQTCRAAAIEMPRPTVRMWCEHGYNVAYEKTYKDLWNHFRVEAPKKVVIDTVPVEEKIEATPVPVVEEKKEEIQTPDEPDYTGKTVRATIPVTLDETALDLLIYEGQNPEEAVVFFCRKHVNADVPLCIRQLLPTVLEQLESISA